MHLLPYDPGTGYFVHNNSIIKVDIFPADLVKAPFIHHWVLLKPGMEMERHSHASLELYFFLAGTGQAIVNGETAAVKPGDSLFLPSDHHHAVANDGDTDLVWLCITYRAVGE